MSDKPDMMEFMGCFTILCAIAMIALAAMHGYEALQTEDAVMSELKTIHMFVDLIFVYCLTH